MYDDIDGMGGDDTVLDDHDLGGVDAADLGLDVPDAAQTAFGGLDGDEPMLGGGGDPGAHPTVVGDPASAVQYWHVQEGAKSCAVVAQESILDEFTGVDHTEAELTEVATQVTGFTPEGGTPPNDTGKLLEHYGIPTELDHDATFEQLQAALAQGDGVIVGVDSSEIWNPGFNPDDALEDYYGIPGQGADHAVRVIGIDYSDPANPQVLLNDSGTPDGQGSAVPLDEFLDAWADSGNLLVTAHRP